MEKRISCPNGGKILTYFEGLYEAVYILLHPFIKPFGIPPNRFEVSPYPSKKEILRNCDLINWNQVLKMSTFENINQIDIGLKTRIGAIGKQFRKLSYSHKIDCLFKDFGLVEPCEGDLGALLKNKLFLALKKLGVEELKVYDEFCFNEEKYSLQNLINKELVSPHGHLYCEELNLLITTHWDSHFSFICSSAENINKILTVDSFDGFLCNENTEVYWSLQKTE